MPDRHICPHRARGLTSALSGDGTANRCPLPPSSGSSEGRRCGGQPTGAVPPEAHQVVQVDVHLGVGSRQLRRTARPAPCCSLLACQAGSTVALAYYTEQFQPTHRHLDRFQAGSHSGITATVGPVRSITVPAGAIGFTDNRELHDWSSLLRECDGDAETDAAGQDCTCGAAAEPTRMVTAGLGAVCVAVSAVAARGPAGEPCERFTAGHDPAGIIRGTCAAEGMQLHSRRRLTIGHSRYSNLEAQNPA